MSVPLKFLSLSSDLEPEPRRAQENKDKIHTNNVLKSLGYQLMDDLGEGGQGQVKLAFAERHPKLVAIKILYPTYPEHVRQELAILKTVRHPNIVQVHEIFEMPDGQTFVVMEAAEMDLDCRMDDYVPIDEARVWFSQLLSAVAHLHQQDIAHRDLKPSNVLLTADGQVKLADFGLGCFSKGFPDLCDTYCGTPEYAAPEVLEHTPYDPKKSDVWGLGVILYEMVTGELPFPGTSYFPMEEPCQSILRSMLQTEPSDRPSVEELVRHPWLQSIPERSDANLECSPHIQMGFLQCWEDNRPISKIPPTPHPPAARAAKSFGVTPILRAFRSLRRRIEKIFRGNNVVHDISSTCQQDDNHSAACSEAPARRLRFPKFKILKKTNKLHPS